MAYVVVAVVAVAVAVFTMQNTTPITVRFLIWQIEALPLAAVILVSLVTGIVLVGIPLELARWRLRSRLRALERRPPAVVDRSDPGSA